MADASWNYKEKAVLSVPLMLLAPSSSMTWKLSP